MRSFRTSILCAVITSAMLLPSASAADPKEEKTAKTRSMVDCGLEVFKKGIVSRYLTPKDLRAIFLLHRGNTSELPSDPVKLDEVEIQHGNTRPIQIQMERDAKGRWIGPDLEPGDLLVVSISFIKGGKVYVVEKYDRVSTKFSGRVFDDETGVDSEVKDFALSPDPVDMKGERVTRPGFFGLRFINRLPCPDTVHGKEP